jgi:PadR family transcriptional regulator PadR
MPKTKVDSRWAVQTRKGVLELCILNALAKRERYGYELVALLSALPGVGITEGTLYPLLSRLWTEGLVKIRPQESTAGPVRKYYGLTPNGRAVLAPMNAYLRELFLACRVLGRR